MTEFLEKERVNETKALIQRWTIENLSRKVARHAGLIEHWNQSWLKNAGPGRSAELSDGHGVFKRLHK